MNCGLIIKCKKIWSNTCNTAKKNRAQKNIFCIKISKQQSKSIGYCWNTILISYLYRKQGCCFICLAKCLLFILTKYMNYELAYFARLWTYQKHARYYEVMAIVRVSRLILYSMSTFYIFQWSRDRYIYAANRWYVTEKKKVLFSKRLIFNKRCFFSTIEFFLGFIDI